MMGADGPAGAASSATRGLARARAIRRPVVRGAVLVSQAIIVIPAAVRTRGDVGVSSSMGCFEGSQGVYLFEIMTSGKFLFAPNVTTSCAIRLPVPFPAGDCLGAADLDPDAFSDLWDRVSCAYSDPVSRTISYLDLSHRRAALSRRLHCGHHKVPIRKGNGVNIEPVLFGTRVAALAVSGCHGILGAGNQFRRRLGVKGVVKGAVAVFPVENLAAFLATGAAGVCRVEHLPRRLIDGFSTYPTADAQDFAPFAVRGKGSGEGGRQDEEKGQGKQGEPC